MLINVANFATTGEPSGVSANVRLLAIFLALFGLWLAMSGFFDNGLLLGFGVISSALCIWIIRRLGLLSEDLRIGSLSIFSAIRYVFWLSVEIGKADWAVTKVILSPGMPLQQRLIRVKSKQNTEIAQALFANSITITPGTVTVETEGDGFIVHALTDEAADIDAIHEMGERVAQLENSQ